MSLVRRNSILVRASVHASFQDQGQSSAAPGQVWKSFLRKAASPHSSRLRLEEAGRERGGATENLRLWNLFLPPPTNFLLKMVLPLVHSFCHFVFCNILLPSVVPHTQPRSLGDSFSHPQIPGEAQRDVWAWSHNTQWGPRLTASPLNSWLSPSGDHTEVK